MSKEKSLIALFPASLRGEGEQMLTLYGELEEIRLRVDKPIILKLHRGEFFFGKDGSYEKKVRCAVHRGRTTAEYVKPDL